MTRTRGTGRVYQQTVPDRTTGKRRKVRTWAIRYYNRRNRDHDNEYGFKTQAEAERALRTRLADQDRGRLVGVAVERTSFDDLRKMIEADYKANGRRSSKRLAQSLAHLAKTFGQARAVDITEDRLAAYVAARREEGAAIASVNRELAALRRMFTLAYDAQRVGRKPRIRTYQEDNVRKGFFEDEQLRAVLRHLPAELRPVIEVAHVTGWRVPSEILTRQWRHVDFDGGWLRLEPGEAKNKEGRAFPLDPHLRPILATLHAQTERLEQEKGRIIPWVFHRDGQRIRYLRRSWITACRKAGVPGRLPHDLRRTAVRNLERAGIPRSVAMALVGHKTESVYRRYVIVDESMLRAAAAKLLTGGR